MTEKIYITADQIQSITAIDKESQETAINWYRNEEDIQICTSDPTMITKLKNIMLRNPDSYKCYYLSSNIDSKGKPIAYTFECSKKLLTFRGNLGTKELDEDERMSIAERLRRKTNC